MLASHMPDQPELFNTTKEAPIPEPDPLLPKVQQQILKNIGYSPVAVDQVIERSGLNAADVNANLVLKLMIIFSPIPAIWFHLKPAKAHWPLILFKFFSIIINGKITILNQNAFTSFHCTNPLQ